MVACDKLQARADELLAAYDRYNANDENLRKELRLEEAQQITGDLCEKIDILFDQIKEIEPVTLEGFRAKTKVLVEWLWEGEIAADGPPRRCLPLVACPCSKAYPVWESIWRWRSRLTDFD